MQQLYTYLVLLWLFNLLSGINPSILLKMYFINSFEFYSIVLSERDIQK